MSYSIFQRIDIRGKDFFSEMFWSFFIMEWGIFRQPRFNSAWRQREGVDERSKAFVPLITSLLTNNTDDSIQQKYISNMGDSWMTPGKETAILEFPNSFSNFTYAGGLHSPPMYLATFFFFLTLKHIGLFAWVKFVSLAGKAFPFHMVRIANLVCLWGGQHYSVVS